MKSIISIVLIAAAISFFIFFTKPKLAELKENRLEVEKLNIAQENAKKLKSRIDSLLKIKNSVTQNDLDKINRMIPNNVENVKLIIDFDNMLQALVSENKTESIYRNAKVSDTGKISIENPKISQGSVLIDGGFDASQVGVADFSFSVSLTYSDFIDFLKRIETSTRIFDIESISFSTPTVLAGKSSNEIVYNFNVTLKTYWLKSK
jgi:hypothetical protein